MTALDISPLGKAIAQLRGGIEILARDPENSLFRDGVIQRFEFTYTLCHKMLLRFLEQNLATPEEVDQMNFSTLVRTASERGLLKSGWDRWQLFRQARNITSHTYDQAKAEQVMSAVPAFLTEAEYLYEQLQQRTE